MATSMSKSITVTPKTLETQSGNIRDDVNTYNKLYEKLVQQVQNLETTWKGEGNKEFARQIQNFKPKFDQLSKVLNSYCDFLNEAARIYRETEGNVKSNAGRLRV